ncbi:MAG: DUF374 domain-containing protein [Calditrichaeota bacterium]|nr:MAG: DUF374 domain-containing protein [Calditrichota bacterium]
MAAIKNRIIFLITQTLGSFFIRMLGKTARITVQGREHYEWLMHENKRFIFCIWHGRILIPIYLHQNEQIVAMVSQHRDGEIIARILTQLGFKTVRGSSTRGGQRAAIDMIRALRSGSPGAIMPDGPTGPRHIFKPGTITIAQKAGAYILPFTFSAQKAITFKSWDRFTIWWPFSRCLALYGEPVPVPAKTSADEFEQYKNKIEKKMIELEEFADAFFRE